ncbi:hypothetical protein lerEdw1_010249 [Lerista edwardsae]|nr:hypothetical protein lerEdw1_010249 [Lerista edwardsae]
MDSAKMCGFLVSGGLLLLTLLGDPARGIVCMCKPRHPQDEYCSAGFVVKAKIVGSSLERDLKRFEIRTTEVFKGPPAKQDLRFLYYIANEKSACGYTDPTPGEEYLVAGIISGKEAWIFLCTLTQPWSALSPELQRGISLYYRKGCSKCSVVDRYSGLVGSPPENICWWDENSSGRTKTLACLPKSGSPDACSWQSMNS